MAWTTPRTWVAAELVTAAIMNPHIRDNENYLYDFSQGLLAGGVPFIFGGNSSHGWNQIDYLVGATLDKLVPNTTVLTVLNTNMPGTLKLEAVLAVTNGPTHSISLAMMNLTDGLPDSPMTNSVITSLSATGEKLQSGVITLAVGTKTYGIKGKISNGTQQGFAWGIRLLRTA